MLQNMVTVFNGLVDYRLAYEVGKEGKQITIPFKKDHLCDAANIAVYGDGIEEVQPPSFPPANSEKATLQISPTQPMESLLGKLSGAKIKLITAGGKTCEGRLIGVDTLQVQGGDGRSIWERSVSIMDDGVLRRIPMEDIAQIAYLEDEVKTEIDKALTANYQKIKQGSVFVTLNVKSTGEKSTAIIGFTTPGAAWASVYRIRQIAAEAFRLELSGIVHNDTESDWTDYKIRLVNGSPANFKTNIANQVCPERQLIKILSETAKGTVEVETGSHAKTVKPASGGSRAFAAPRAACVLESVQPQGLADYVGDFIMDTVKTPGADASEDADFCIFTPARSITIPANRAASIELVGTDLRQTESLLYYNTDKHDSHAWRALKFINELEHSLGRGPCDVFRGDLFAGKCVMPSMKPGETAFLVHAEEHGVKVLTEKTETEASITSVKISDGIAFIERSTRVQSVYTFKNVRAEAFKLVMDFTRMWENSKVTVDGATISEELKKATRITAEIPQNTEMSIKVTETRLDSVKHILTDMADNWLFVTLFNIDKPIGTDDKNVKKCIAIKELLDKCDREYGILQRKSATLESNARQIRENLKVTTGEVTKEWSVDLKTNQLEQKELTEKTMPAKEEERQRIRKDLYEAFKKLTITYGT